MTSSTPLNNQPNSNTDSESDIVSVLLCASTNELLTAFTIQRELAPAGRELDGKLEALHQALLQFYNELSYSQRRPRNIARILAQEDEDDGLPGLDTSLIDVYMEEEQELERQRREQEQEQQNQGSSAPSALSAPSSQAVSRSEQVRLYLRALGPVSPCLSSSSSDGDLPPYTPAPNLGVSLPFPPGTTVGGVDSSAFFIFYSATPPSTEIPFYPAPDYRPRNMVLRPGVKWQAIFKGRCVGVIYDWDNAKPYVKGPGLRYTTWQGFTTCMAACQEFWKRHALGEVKVVVPAPQVPQAPLPEVFPANR
ncbi:hypothetical protein CVT24_001616 [Panaeolus cyanescens]|uniref:Uncharacterized protein n=1 Tax=Panaeolus cyanescens TaxID=181874 RepID=A0A409W3L4_9AGAR|nr:hypothetical protein CVT24_001616 [Panaeolus cyanescens]